MRFAPRSEDAVEARVVYRLPLTFVRVVGGRTEAVDDITQETHVSCESVVTTELAADLQTLLTVDLGTHASANRSLTLQLHADGRLKGAEDSVAVDRFAAWAPFVRLSALGLAVALPWVVPGAAGAAAAASALVVGTASRRNAGPESASAEEASRDLTPDERRLARYEQERKGPHALLVALRAGLATQEEVLADAARSGADLDPVRRRSAALRSELNRAETAYQAFLHRHATVRIEAVDERMGVDDLPSEEELRDWLEVGREADSVDWPRLERLTDKLRVAVSVDVLDEYQRQAQVAERDQLYNPAGAGDRVGFRRPRLAAVRVWRVGALGQGSARSLELVEERQLLVSYPGNETFLPLGGHSRNSATIKLAFDEQGALASMTAEQTGSARQRAEGVNGVVTALTEGASAGRDLRDTFALPSLEEQVKAAENLRKLQPVEPVDPDVEEMLRQIEEEERKARLRLAMQLGTATSPPVVVTVTSG